MDTFNFKFRTLLFALTGVLFLSIGDAYSMGSVYSDGRAFLRPSCPSGAGKVYVGKSASETTMATPASSSFKACNSSTSPAMTQQEQGTEKKTWYHFFAQANAGYKFTGWYDPDDKRVAMTDASRNYYRSVIQSGTMALNGDLHAYLDMYAGFIKCIQMSFVRPESGSFTITNNGTSVSNYATFTVDGIVTLQALPADGYKLRGWYTTTNGGVTKNYVAFGQTYEPTNFTSNVTIGAEFVPDDGKATFWIKGTNQLYGDLSAANTAAVSSSSKTIVVVSDGVVGAGTYTINSGVTLLIPFKETYDVMTKPRVIKVANSSATYMKTTTFRKLALANGATINCYGNICVGGTLASVGGGNASSFPTGAVGMIDMSKGGTINLKSGSNLYAWGFVKGQDMDQGNNTTGCGQINAESGSHVWEFFQVGDWRGGNNCLTIYNNETWRFFPFQAWSMQNVEVPVTYNYGATGHCYWSIFGNGEINTITFSAITPVGANPAGIFQVASGATVKKWYDPTTDRVCVELHKSSQLDAITLDILGETVSSKDYNLPLPANLRIILASDANSTISKPVVAHAGSIIEVQPGARLNLTSTLYLFDTDEWDAFCMKTNYFCAYESPSIHFNRGATNTKANLEDATIIADGQVVVSGNLYATAGGANIKGNNNGTIQYSKVPGNTTMTMCKDYATGRAIYVRQANLHNENGTYTKGSVATYKNVNGRWFLSAKSTPKSNKTYDFTYIKSGNVYGTDGTNATVSACYSWNITGLSLQQKWANIKAGECDDWWVGIDDGCFYNYTEENAWHQYIKTGTITIGEDDEEQIVDVYAGSNGKLYYNQDCDITEEGEAEGCLFTVDAVQKALVNGTFVNVVKNTGDEAYHKSDAATTYYICFEGCVWKPATKIAGKEQAYTVESVPYLWYDGAWVAVELDATVGLYYSLDASNVKVYYDYVSGAWTHAQPVAEVVTSSGTELVYSMATAITKAKAGGTNVTIRLLKSLSTGQFSYNGSNNCSLDLNGFTLTINTSSPIYVNNASAKVIIKDQSASGTGKILTKYNRTDGMVYGINVKLGCCILNSGTVHIENTNTANTQGACGATVSEGQSLIINGGTLEALSNFETRGINHGASTTVTINGGTVKATTSATAQCPYGIYSTGGTIDMKGGLVYAERTVDTGDTNKKYVYGIILMNNACRLNMTGGEVKAKALNRAYGLQVGTSSQTSAVATLTGGTITAETTVSHSPLSILSYATTNLSGVTLKATAKSSSGYGIYVNGGTTTCNAGTVVDVNATSNAYGFYMNGGTLNVKGGTIKATTTSTTNAYGIYTKNAAVVTTEGGDFKVTAKTTGAYAAYMTTDATGSCTLGGGKYMVKTSGGTSTSNAYVNNTDAPTGKLVLAGGYYNLIPSNTYVQAGKAAKDLDATAEADLIAAGYIKKIAGNEYAVTWKNMDESVLGTTMVESGKVPEWKGETPTYATASYSYVFDGWSATKGGAKLDPLPAITSVPVTYYAHYSIVYAEVIANGVTTPYISAQTAWAEVLKYKQATIRLLSNIGTEAVVGNMTQLVFNPTNANSIITMDLNGHSWTMGNNANAAYNVSPFLHVNPAQTGCKLIITDNSASGNGYLLNKWLKDGTVIHCVLVAKGELVLQGGGIRAINTSTSDGYSTAVGVSNGAQFSMTGGKIYASDAYTPRGINVAAGGKADITGGTIHADATNSTSYAILPYGTVNVGGEAVVKATAANANAYVAQTSGTLNVDGGTYIAVAGSGARVFFATGGGKITIDGDPVVGDTVRTGNDAYAVMANGANSEVVVNSGTYTLKGEARNVFGCYALSNGTVTMNGGSFTLNGGTSWTFGAYVTTNGTLNLNGGSITVSQTAIGNVEAIRVYPTGICNITGGSYTVTHEGNGDAMRICGGTTNISGNPVFTGYAGLNVGDVPVAAGTLTATVVIDGGTFNTKSFAVRSLSTTTTTGTITGDVTIWDGKFLSPNWVVGTNSPASCLKIRGGWYSNNANGKINTGSGNYVVSPSKVKTLTTADQPEYGEGYRYHVQTQYTVTWSIDGVNTNEFFNRDETPVYGSVPTMSGPDTYEFIGWEHGGEFYADTVALPAVKGDVIYTAVFRKIEAEIYEGESTTPQRYERFNDAWNVAKNLPVVKVKLLSNVSRADQLVLTPDSAAIKPWLTLDLNNHTLSYTGTADRFIKVDKDEARMIITDNSAGKGGMINFTGNYNGCIFGIVTYGASELQLDGGKIFIKNTYSGKNARGVATVGTSTFIMTGGTVQVEAPTQARGIVATDDNTSPTIRISGGNVIAKSFTVSGSDTTWTDYAYAIVFAKGSVEITGNPTITGDATMGAYGVYLDGTASSDIRGGTIIATAHKGNYGYAIYYNGTQNNQISGSPTVKAICKDGQTAHAIHAYSNSKATITGGTFYSCTPSYQSHCVFVQNSELTISGGTFTGATESSAGQNVEAVRVYSGAVCTIDGGTFTSTSSPFSMALRALGGTTTINGGTFTAKSQAIAAADANIGVEGTVNVNINGGTFISTDKYVLYSSSTNSNKTIGEIKVNGGYFFTSANNYIANKANLGTIVLYGGKYNETSGTNHKNNLNTYKYTTTNLTPINETVDGKNYVYQLSTPFTVSWRGGDSYSKDEVVTGGAMPANTELEGKHFMRNDSAFYFTGWDPAPAAVVGDITYQALGEYYEAKVTVASSDTLFDNLREAWDYAMVQPNATITLLNNVTLTEALIYRPEEENARHTFDLNNFTVTRNTDDRLLIVNKADAILTITDNSTAKGGRLYSKKSHASILYLCRINAGELKVTGGTLYVENTDATKSAIAVYLTPTSNAKLTATGGTIEAKAVTGAYPIYSYGMVNISGNCKINATATASMAIGIYVFGNTSTISGGTFTVSAPMHAYGVNVSGDANGATMYNGVGTITGGTFNVTATASTAVGAQVKGSARNAGGTIYKAFGTLNVAGGTFTVKCSAASATQVFGVQCSAARIFDSATPHTMIAESQGIAIISGGTFTVDTRNNGAWVTNGENVDLLRSWGTMNVTGGNFTIYQASSAVGVSSYRNKITVSGNPVFNVHCQTKARGVVTASWNHSDYCDKDASNNLAEVEVNGGTFNVTATDGDVIGAWVNGHISTKEVAGYAMSSKVTVNGGEFICSAPSNVRMFLQNASPSPGGYGTALREIYVNGGKFKSQIGTVAADGTVTPTGTGNNIEGARLLGLTGGYFNTDHRLASDVSDECEVHDVTGSEPEYASGYRHKIVIHKAVKVEAGGVTKYFAVLDRALTYAGTQNNPVITVLDDVTFTGPYNFNPTVADWRGTLDLNNKTVTSTSSSDRFFSSKRADAKLTITDNSGEKGGVWNMTKAYSGGELNTMVIDNGEVILAGGKLHMENTQSGANLTGVNVYGTSGKFTQTGGMMEVRAYGTTNCVKMRGTAVISGGNDTITSVSGSARGFVLAADAANSKYGSLTVSGTAHIGVSGNVAVMGVYTDIANATATVSGGTFNVLSNTTQAYGIRYNAASTATVSGGTFNVCSTGDHSCGVNIQTGARVDITGGTFNITTAQSADKSWYNIEGIRSFSGASTEFNISGGTFNVTNRSKSTNATGVRSYAGTVNISGTTAINANQCFRIVDAYQAEATAYVNVSGGTFTSVTNGFYANTVTGTGTNAGKVNKADVNVTGGHFISTAAIHIDSTTPVALLKINGGYFNEYSGSTSKNNVNNYCVSPKHAIQMTSAECTTVGMPANSYKVVDAYMLEWITDGDPLTGNYTSGMTEVGTAITAPNTPAKTGYTFKAWSPAVAATMPAANTTYTATWTPNTTTAYTVKHYQQNLDGTYPSTPTNTDNLTGTTGASVTPAVKSYTGFTAPGTQTKTIAADGSMVIEYKYTRNSYTLTWNLDGGSISVPGTSAGSVKYGTALVAPTVVKTGYTFAAWSPAVAATMPAANTTYTATWTQNEKGDYLDIVDWMDDELTINVSGWDINGWPYTVNNVVYEKDDRDPDRTLTIPYSGAVGDEITITVTDKNGAVVSEHTYVVPMNVTSPTTITTNYSFNIYVHGTTLTVNANITAKNIYVSSNAKIVINSGKTLTADSLFLRTDIEQSAELNNKGTIAGTTKVFYTRQVSRKDTYYQFGLPWSVSVAVKDIRLANGKNPKYGATGGWILRSYNEETRAANGQGNNWVTLAENAVITGGVGYEMYSDVNYYREFYFPVTVPSPLPTSVPVTHHDGAAGATESGWNILVTPLTSSYANSQYPEAPVICWMTPHGFEQDIPATIPPARVFAYQAAQNGVLSFAGSSIVLNHAPRRIKAEDEEVRIQWVQLDIEDKNGDGDQTSVYSHPTRYEQSYKTGIDVAKQMFTGPHAILYSTHAYGEMAFAGVADAVLEQGIPLTVYSPSAQELTISMRDNEWLERLEKVYLVDKETGLRIDLFMQDYRFDAEAGTTEGRFVLQGVFKALHGTTDIENGDVSDGKQVRKLLIKDKMYIMVNDQLYDATGKQVK